MKPSPTIALDVLIGACERRLGAEAPIARQLRRLRAERTGAAFERARTAFDALQGELRADLAEDAYRLAAEMRRAPVMRVAQKFGLIGTLNRRR
jgi:hypothetical protein